jgi:hypothetical protein
MRAQLDRPGMKLDPIAAPLQYGALEIVVKNHARPPVPIRKRMHVAAQEIFRWRRFSSVRRKSSGGSARGFPD